MKVTKLPEYLRTMRRDIDDLMKSIQEAYKRIDSERSEQEKFNAELYELKVRNAELEHMVRLVTSRPSQPSGADKKGGPQPKDSKELFADDHALDTFYLDFENKFRGSEQDVQKKQEPYVPIFEKTSLGKKHPIVDLGCGRGEFLGLLKDAKLKAIGVDMNESMVQRAKDKGFEAVNDEGIHYLSQQKSGTLAGVTGFQLAEHIPFEILLTLIAEAHRCLAKGGVLLLETPNPESLYVGAFTFHYDPSHLKPIPPAVMQFAAKFKGFERTEIMRMQPEMTDEQIKTATKNPQLQDALKRLYGARDYALVAYK